MGLCRIRIDIELLKELLHMPDGCTIVGADMSLYPSQSLSMLIHSDNVSNDRGVPNADIVIQLDNGKITGSKLLVHSTDPNLPSSKQANKLFNITDDK